MDLPPGHYYHFGVQASIIRAIRRCCRSIANLGNLQLLVGVDGTPTSKSTKQEMWPILGLLKNTGNDDADPFVIGLYIEPTKPNSANDFLTPFVDEMVEVDEKGIDFDGNDVIRVKLIGFSCDAPARAYLKYIKTHTGYSACERCTATGEYYCNRVVFRHGSGSLRTNESFRNQTDPEHHRGTSVLQRLPLFDMVNGFPLDYMHLILLGVVKKMLTALTTNIKKVFKVKLPTHVIADITGRLQGCAGWLPVEFQRKTRALEEISRWKAIELRTFLLFVGPIVLKNNVDDKYYIHFLKLHVAIKILLTPVVCQTYNSLADALINEYAEDCASLYGLSFLSYNVHGMEHVADDALRYGHLDRVSTFPFENKLGELKRLLRKPGEPLIQIVHRITEYERKKHTFPIKKNAATVESSKHTNGPIFPGLDKDIKPYNTLKFFGSRISTARPNNCVILNNNDVVIVKNIVLKVSGEIIIIASPCTMKKTFTLFPFRLPSKKTEIPKKFFFIVNIRHLHSFQ